MTESVPIVRIEEYLWLTTHGLAEFRHVNLRRHVLLAGWPNQVIKSIDMRPVAEPLVKGIVRNLATFVQKFWIFGQAIRSLFYLSGGQIHRSIREDGLEVRRQHCDCSRGNCFKHSSTESLVHCRMVVIGVNVDLAKEFKRRKCTELINSPVLRDSPQY